MKRTRSWLALWAGFVAAASPALGAREAAALAEEFKNPPAEYRPWTRWWWPGGDVDPNRAAAEVRTFADNLFAGVEIQPFLSGVLRKDFGPRVFSYDTPGFYVALGAVLEEARARGIRVDVTAGSGWPAGGAHVPLQDNLHTLIHGEAVVTGPADIPVPPPNITAAYIILGPSSPIGFVSQFFHPEAARLVTLLAARITDYGRSPSPLNVADTVTLDPSSVVEITDRIQGGRVVWTPPSPGAWQVISIYDMPAGHRPSFIAASPFQEAYSVDHFDAAKLRGHYDRIFGPATGLTRHFGGPLRAVFNDSLEFNVERHFSAQLLDRFRRLNGYDVKPYLPATLVPGHDNENFHIFSPFFFPVVAPEFNLTGMDDRISYDYSLAVSDLLMENFVDATRSWAGERGLLSRAQAFGADIDVIKAAGRSDLPETEQLFAGGADASIKLVTSGAHLYGRPVIAAEALVHQGGAYMATPQSIRQDADQLLVNGVNQLIYHGASYRWDSPGYGEPGWYPWAPPGFALGVNFAENISPGNPMLWARIKDINAYVARGQRLMRLGAPDADLLIYAPLFGARAIAPAVADVLRAVDERGLTWDWVNDDVLSGAEWRGRSVKVRGRRYAGIVLPHVTSLPIPVARRLQALAEAGAPVLVVGAPPARQPGFKDHVENDQRVARHMARALAAVGGPIDGAEALARALDRLPAGPIGFAGKHPSLRQARRALPGGAALSYLRNTGAEPVDFTLKVDRGLADCRWLDPVDGKVYRARQDRAGRLSGRLAGNEALALHCGGACPFGSEEISSRDRVGVPSVSSVLPVDGWRLEVNGSDVPGGGVVIADNALGDWRDKEPLRFSSSVGVYSATVRVQQVLPSQRYVLRLGALHGPAEVEINGRPAGAALFQPYDLDVTDLLKAGDNAIRVTVTPVLRNRFVGLALTDPLYGGWTGSALAPTGLAGPVRVEVRSRH